MLLVMLLGVCVLLGLGLGFAVAKRRFQFGLRALLIAMTLVALTLGLIVYLLPKPPAKPPLNVGDFPTRVN